MMDEFLKKRNLLRDSCSVSPREFKVFSLDGSHQPLPLELCMHMHMHSTEATMHTVCITSTILVEKVMPEKAFGHARQHLDSNFDYTTPGCAKYAAISMFTVALLSASFILRPLTLDSLLLCAY